MKITILKRNNKSIQFFVQVFLYSKQKNTGQKMMSICLPKFGDFGDPFSRAYRTCLWQYSLSSTEKYWHNEYIIQIS